MKTILFLFFIVFSLSFSAFTQTVTFTYDDSGNRTRRWIEVGEMKESTADTSFRPIKEFRPTTEVRALSDVRVFPNPVAEALNVVIGLSGEATATARIYDVQGRPVISVPVLSAHHILDLSGLAPGTYLLLQCDGEQRAWKLVKE
jgi:hypothetical protein